MYNKIVSTYIAKLLKNIESQTKASVFHTKDPMSGTGFLPAFRLAYDSSRILESATVLVLPHYVNEPLAGAYISRICAKDKSFPKTASVYNNDTRSRIHLRSYSAVDSYLLKKFSTILVIAEFHAAMLRYMQPKNLVAHAICQQSSL